MVKYFFSMGMAKSILWWGRWPQKDSRNLILRKLAAELGCEVRSFRPALSRLGDVEASLRRIPAPDAIWVASFRLRDLAAACRWGRKHGAKTLFDPVVSAYLKQVFEKRKFPEGSGRAKRLLRREQGLFALPDLVVADTKCHAEAFRDVLGVPEGRLATIYIGADESTFTPAPLPERKPDEPLEVLFYGSFIPLHGATTIVRAAHLAAGENIRWTLLGDGPLREECIREARGAQNIVFEGYSPMEKLAEKIRGSDVLLGVFGETPQASRVMPNKFFQSIACARPVVTRLSEAYPQAALDSAGVRFIEPGNPRALLDAVLAWRELPVREEAAKAARRLYCECFSNDVVKGQLALALA